MGSSTVEVEIPEIEITWLGPGRLPPRWYMQHPVVIWDLDSSIARTERRRWLLDQILTDEPTATWEDYAMLCEDDEPIPGAVRLVELLSGAHLQLILTGRAEKARDLTVKWLDKHSVMADGLVMRPAVLDSRSGHPKNDAATNVKLKVNWIKQLQALGYDVRLVMEDWKETAEHIAAETGIPVLRITEEAVAVIGGV